MRGKTVRVVRREIALLNGQERTLLNGQERTLLTGECGHVAVRRGLTAQKVVLCMECRRQERDRDPAC